MSIFSRFVPFLAVLVALGSATATIAFADDFTDIELTLGSKGQVQEGALIVRFPRGDLKVAVDGEQMPTALGFVSWTAWKNMGHTTVVMGDLVLLEKEINPVISVLEQANIDVTAVHSHFIYDNPRIMFLHLYGAGRGKSLALGIRNALLKTSTPLQDGTGSSASLSLETKRIDEIIGYSGINAGGVYKITVGRPGVSVRGMDLTSGMGMNSWAGFTGTSQRAHVAGDIAMTGAEVNRVIRALRRGGIEIVALHNHMLDEEPRMFFLHFWGTGPAEILAQTIREALNEVQGPVP